MLSFIFELVNSNYDVQEIRRNLMRRYIYYRSFTIESEWVNFIVKLHTITLFIYDLYRRSILVLSCHSVQNLLLRCICCDDSRLKGYVDKNSFYH